MSTAAVELPPIRDAAPVAQRPRRMHLWLLLAITLLGGVLRFGTISRPPIWGDEAMTYARVSGTFRDLLDCLQYDGFVPLHYELYWLIQHYIAPLTPPVLRFVPALCGTLMIPAIYFLGMQIVSRRAALLAALFTSVSAYMMVYSHDAKMYMDCWFFSTLSAACVLWWLRSGRRVAWLAWVASALVASGLHVWGVVPSGLALVFGLSRVVTAGWPLGGAGQESGPRTARLPQQMDGSGHLLGEPGGPPPAVADIRWFAKQLLALLLGMGVIGAGVAGFYLGYNRMVQNLDDPHTGLPYAVSWVQNYNQGRSGPDLALFTATAHLYSWEWPGGVKYGYIPPWQLHWLEASGVMLLLLVGLGMMPWKPRVSNPFTPSPPHPLTPSPPLEPPWRQFLWLAVWIVLPCYGFYCISMRQFASPLSWFVAVGDLFSQHWLVLAIGWVLLAVAFARWPMAARCVGAAALVAAAAVFAIKLLNVPWKLNANWHQLTSADAWTNFGDALWLAGAGWMDWVGQSLVLGATIALLPPLLWHFSGATLARRMRQTAQYVAVAATCLLLCLAIYGFAQGHYRSEVRKILAHRDEFSLWNTYLRQAQQDHGVPPREAALGRILADRPAAGPAAARSAADDLIKQAKVRWDALVASGHDGQSAQQAAAEQIAAEHWVWDWNWPSQWMPRYLGVIWPAVAIAACCLLLRLPTRPLRWGAIALLLAINATQTAARLLAGSEPPMQIISADILAAQSKTPDGHLAQGKDAIPSLTRTYFASNIDTDLGGHPGTMSLLGSELKYYLEAGNAKVLPPREFRDLGGDVSFFQRVQGVEIVMVGGRSTSIAHDLKTHPQTQRIIMWDRLPPPKPGVNLDAFPDAAHLGENWKMVSEQRFVGRMHWVWQELYTLRRRVYEKIH